MPTFLDLSEAKRTPLPAPPAPLPATPVRTLSVESAPGAVAPGMGGNQQGFAAAKVNRLTLDFLASSRSADQDLFGDNIRLRARARKLAIDTPFARKFLQMVAQNVVGPAGIQLQAEVRNAYGAETAATREINLRIEQAWEEWCAVGNCTADGRFSFHELQTMCIKNVAREGENLLKLVYGRQFNAVGFALQPLDNDQLDDNLQQQLAAGEIRMGVEVDSYRRPLAYHLWDGHPYEAFNRTRTRRRIPAAEIIHSYVVERPAQTRGYTFMSSAILEMQHYDKFTEATMVAARASAAKFMVVKQAVAEGGYAGADQDGEGADTNSDGTQRMSANAGEGLVLDPGQDVEYIDPRFPTNTFEAFTRTCVRNIASGLLVSYNSLGNDLVGVNFSSIRAGMLDERDSWRTLQRWYIDHFLRPIFAAWVRMAALTVLADLNLTPGQMRQVSWKARGWDWVDPLKDAQAVVLKLGNSLTTYADELAATGRDFEKTVDARAKEQEYIASKGLVLGTDISGDQGGKGVAAGDAPAPDDEDAAKPATKPATVKKPAAAKP